MLRSEIISASANVVDALKRAHVVDALRTDEIEMFMRTFHTFSTYFTNSTNAERELLDVFELSPLLEAGWWVKLVGGKDDEGRTLRSEMYQNVLFTLNQLPKVTQLLKGDRQSTAPQAAQITLLVPEGPGQKSSPARVIEAIESVVLFYGAMCKLHNQPENSLELVRCDSGSDKSFDFTGIPQIIEQVKSVIFGMMDRLIFFRERKYSERVKCVAESLPVLSQIADMIDGKKLSAEQGELLRRDLINGATRFLETGSSIPEIQDQSRYQPTVLIAPSPTLLIEGPKDGQSPAKGADIGRGRHPKHRRKTPNQAALSPEEIEELIRSNPNITTNDQEKLLAALRKKIT